MDGWVVLVRREEFVRGFLGHWKDYWKERKEKKEMFACVLGHINNELSMYIVFNRRSYNFDGSFTFALAFCRDIRWCWKSW